MTHAQEVEQRWERRGIVALLLLALTLVILVGFSVIQTSNDRAEAADRAERTAAELHVLADRLDQQAAALDRQAKALEKQAAALEDRTVRADRSREQFRDAAREILEQLGSDLDAFEPEPVGVPRVPSALPDPVPDPPELLSEPAPVPEPTVTESGSSEPVEPAPGCEKSGGRPPKCDGDDQ